MRMDDRMPSTGVGTPTGPPEVLPDPPLEPTRPGEPPRIEPQLPDPQEPWSEPNAPEPPTPRPLELPPQPPERAH